MTTKRLNRDQFEALRSKQQKAYVKKTYPDIRKEVISDYWEEGNAYQGKDLRTTIHHCWEKGMGGAIPLWYYIDKRNMVLWSLVCHVAYHDTPRSMWTKVMKKWAEEADDKKESMIEDDRIYKNSQGTTYSGLAKDS